MGMENNKGTGPSQLSLGYNRNIMETKRLSQPPTEYNGIGRAVAGQPDSILTTI